MNKKAKFIALAMCLVMLFDSSAVFRVFAADSGDSLRSGAVTVTGALPKKASLSAKKIGSPFTETNPSPWWLGWAWGWYNSMQNRVEKATKSNPAPTRNASFEALAYYDIKLKNGNETVSPEGPVTVTIGKLKIPKDKGLQVIHVLDDVDAIRRAVAAGTASAFDAPGFVEAFPAEAKAAYEALGVENVVYVEYFTTTDGTLKIVDKSTISFKTDSFSVFIITEAALETSIVASDGNTYDISAHYDVRADIPGDAVLQVEEILPGTTEYSNYVTKAAKKIGCGAEDLSYVRLFDISLYGTVTGEYYQPGTSVTVSIRLRDVEFTDASELSVVHFGKKVEKMSYKVEDGELSFSTDGFSVYVLAAGTYRHTYRFFVPTDNTQTTFEEYRIYTDNGETTFTQIIKNHEELVMPQLPSIANSPTSTFAGWYEGTESGGSVNISGDPFDFTNLPAITSDREIHLYARFGKFAYVIFHDQYNGTTNTWPITATRRGEIQTGATTTSVRIDDVTVSYDDSANQQTLAPGETPPPPAMAFRGWTTEDSIQTDAQGTPYVPENAPILSSPLVIPVNTHLYPVFSHINWLTTVSGPTGSGATYFAPTFYYSDEGLPNLSAYIPERKGYVFDGWYTQKDANGNGTGVQITNASGTITATTAQLSGTGLSVSGVQLMLSQNVTIYAKWTPGPATYTIVIWRQSVTDNNSTTDTPADLAQWLAADPSRNASDYPKTIKSYDFAESFVINGTSEGIATVAATYKQRSGGAYEGFYYSCCDADSIITGNGTTVLNVYYDRELRTILFRNHPQGATVYYYTPTTATNGTQYGYVDGNFVQLTNVTSFYSADGGKTQYSGTIYYETTNNNNVTQYGYVGGELVQLTRFQSRFAYNNVAYNGTRYLRTNDNNGTQYGFSNGEMIQLTRTGGTWYLNGTTYTGNRYTVTTNTTNQTYYGVVDGAVVQLSRGNNDTSYTGWSYNNNMYTGTRFTTNTSYAANTAYAYGYDSGTGMISLTQYSCTYNGSVYTGRRYTRNTQNSAVVWVGLYAQTLSQAGYNWNDMSGLQWYANTSASGTIQTLVDSFNLTNDNSGTVYNLYRSGYAGDSDIIHYKQNLDGKYTTEASVTAHGSGGTFSFQNKFFGFTVSTYNSGNNGYNPDGGSNPTTGNASSYPLHIYHTRNSYTLTFLDSYDDSYAYGTESNSTVTLLYEEPLSGYNPTQSPVSSREGYEFSGWYYDQSCTTRVDWSKPMPGGNMVVYAGWSTEWYLIKIDPNGGEFPLGSNYSTWFWKQYGTTELIVEYENTERDYAESLNGTWYYAVQDRNHYGLTDEWESREDYIHDRRTYYTQDISDDAITDLDRKYKFAEGEYRYANWFEVLYDNNGNEIGEELYNFSRRIDHNTTLRLHWKHVGTYHIRYEAGTGELDGNDSNEDTFHLLDESDYADRSNVIVTRTATPPDGYNFIGWRIRGDESGTIYYPGLAMEFQPKFTVKDTDQNGDIHEYLVLDAVYTVAKTAVIIYDANGGSVNSSTVDYGHPQAVDAPLTQKSCTETDATITNLVNNTGIVLSNGTGFSHTNARIVGWNTQPDGNGTHFALGGSYYVDAEEPIRLYAEWQVRVYFYKNNTETGSTYGGTWDSGVYTYDSAKDCYYTTVLLGHSVDLPPYTPTDPRDDVVFHFWSPTRYVYPALGDDVYDFSQPVNDELHLYAYWAMPIEVPVHAVDSTSGLVNKDTWLISNSIKVISGTDMPTATTADAAVYVDVPPAQPGEDDYLFAFACISDSIDHITEDKIINSVYYDNATRSAWVHYANGTSGQLPDDDEIYFVYFRYPRTVNIEYKVMDTTGALSDPSTLSDQRPTSASIGDYTMGTDTAQTAVTAPREWTSNNYAYYSFAIGDIDAANSGGLRFVSAASNSDSSRPALRVQNFWNGYRYSTDGGTTWIPCGKDITLYVIYYENQTQPVIVTVNELTVGLAEDLLEDFEYTVVVTETVTNYTRTDQFTRNGNSGNYTYTLTQTGTPAIQGEPTTTTLTSASHTFDLRNGESNSETVFYSKTTDAYGSYTRVGSTGNTYQSTATYSVTTQTITITQTHKAGFVTITDKSSDTPEYVYTYTTAENSTDQVVTYTNTRTPFRIEVHVAVTDNGSVILKDGTMRSSNTSDYTFNVNIGETVDLSALGLDPFSGDTSVYALAGILYGTHANGSTDVSVISTAESVSYQTVPPGTYYDLFYNGDESKLLGGTAAVDGETSYLYQADGGPVYYQIYYLYYKMPTVKYVHQTTAGTLVPYDPIRRNGASVTLNGHTVAQGDTIPVSESGTAVSQSISGGFRVPPDLDGSDTLSADYVRIGVGLSGNITNVSGLAATNDGKLLYLKAFDGQLKWSFDNSTWNNFAGTPTVYVIYRDEQDNRLVIVREDGAAEQDFWYTVSGPNGVVIEVCIPAGSDRVTITGVDYGDYTAVEHGDWSWRFLTENVKSTTIYGPEDIRPTGALIGDSTIHFAGAQNEYDWLNGIDRDQNQYNS